MDALYVTIKVTVAELLEVHCEGEVVMPGYAGVQRSASEVPDPIPVFAAQQQPQH